MRLSWNESARARGVLRRGLAVFGSLRPSRPPTILWTPSVFVATLPSLAKEKVNQVVELA